MEKINQENFTFKALSAEERLNHWKEFERYLKERKDPHLENINPEHLTDNDLLMAIACLKNTSMPETWKQFRQELANVPKKGEGVSRHNLSAALANKLSIDMANSLK